MTAPGAPGETAAIYQVCALFRSHPELHYKDIVIRESGRVEITCVGGTGVTKEWARALPRHRPHAGMAATFYGLTEADVLEQDGITVTISRPLHTGPGGA